MSNLYHPILERQLNTRLQGTDINFIESGKNNLGHRFNDLLLDITTIYNLIDKHYNLAKHISHIAKKQNLNFNIFETLATEIRDILTLASLENNKIIYNSPIIKTLLGFEPSEFLYFDYFDKFIYIDDLILVKQCRKLLLDTKEPQIISYRVRYFNNKENNNKYIWIESHFAITNNKKYIAISTRVIPTTNNFLYKIRTENINENINNNNEPNLISIINSSAYIIVSRTANIVIETGNILYVSSAFAALLKMKNKNILVGHNILELLPQKSDKEKLQRLLSLPVSTHSQHSPLFIQLSNINTTHKNSFTNNDIITSNNDNITRELKVEVIVLNETEITIIFNV